MTSHQFIGDMLGRAEVKSSLIDSSARDSPDDALASVLRQRLDVLKICDADRSSDAIVGSVQMKPAELAKC